MMEDKHLHEAIDRLARTADGRILYLFLQKKMTEVADLPTDGALRANHGERMFASKLTGLMAKGISESGGRTSSAGGSPIGDQPIIFAVPIAVDAGRGRGAGRRITADTRIPGYDSDAG